MIPHSQPWITEDDKSTLSKLMDTKMLSKGEVMSNLKKSFANYLNKNYTLFTGNGTQAQVLLLKALGIGEGDEVIVPTYVCDKVLKAIIFVGATPVICDVNGFWVMDEHTIAQKISKKTKAIILVHIFGINAYTDNLRQFNVPIIEDICQSIGENEGVKTGTFTDFAFASFHGTKMLAAGEGGMLFVNSKEVYENCLNFQNKLGIFNKGTDLIASLLINQLNRIEKNIMHRKSIASRYTKELPQELVRKFIEMPLKTMYFRYLLNTNKDFDEIKNAYQSEGIAVRRGVDALLHLEYSKYSNGGTYNNSEELFKSTVSIPILPHLSDKQVSHIISTTHKLFQKGII